MRRETANFQDRDVSTSPDNESREFVGKSIAEAGLGQREDLATWFDWLDADDYVSYGGKA